MQCRWFAMCPNRADGTVSHPVLGDVPCCTRCSSRFGMKLRKLRKNEWIQEVSR